MNEIKNFNIDEFSPFKNYVIEASAGTGKTYSVVQIVKKLVNNGEDINKILIVTYTDKAAGELKNRIREAVKDKGVNADNLPIFTIHSFCKSTISEFGYSLNLPLSLSMIDDSFLDRFLTRYLREGKIYQDIQNLMVLGNRQIENIDTFKKCFKDALSKYYLNLNNEEDSSIISLEECENLKEIYENSKIFYEATSLIDLYKINGFKDNLKALKLLSDDYSKECYKILINFDKNNKFKYLKTVSEFDDRVQNNKERSELLKYFKELAISTVSSTDSQKVIVYKYLKDLYISFNKYKEINKSQNFDDLIRNVREKILTDESFKNKLKEKYHRAIIDEFQDTNQKQFDIFKSIFMEDDDHKILVVGDPKQSIYSFQGADISVYNKAKKEISDNNGEILNLGKNYRSTKGIVEACNTLFSLNEFKNIFPPKIDKKSGNKTVVIYDSPFTFNSSLYREEKEGAIDGLVGDKVVKPFWMGEFEDHKDYAECVAQTILKYTKLDDNGNTKLKIIDKKTKEYRNVSFKDFTILSRTSSEMKEIMTVLKRAGIPFVRYKDISLYKGKECKSWIAVLEAISTPEFKGKERNKFKKSLFTDFFGYSLKEIKKEKYNHDDINEIEIFNRWKTLNEEERYEDLIDDIMLSSNLIKNNSSIKQLQSFSIFKQIGDFNISFLTKGHSLNELIEKLDSLSNGVTNSDEDDEKGNIVDIATNFNSVQIMTIHASKGLQFPIVISYAGFKGLNNKINVATYHDKENKLKLAFFNTEDSKKELIEEFVRLFYVAYTRSEYVLMLPIFKKFGSGLEFLLESMKTFYNDLNNEKFIEKVELDKTYSFYQMNKDVRHILSKDLKILDLKEKDKQDDVLKELINFSYKKKTYKYSYTTLSHGEDDKEDENYDNKEGEIVEGLSKYDKLGITKLIKYDSSKLDLSLPPSFPKGAKIGTTLHEIFEKLDFVNYENDSLRNIESSFKNNHLELNDTFIEPLKTMISNTMNALFPIINGNNIKEEYFSLKEIEIKNKKAEVEFNFNFLDQRLRNYCNGFIDLIFRRGEYYSIIDWKSDTLNEDFTSYFSLGELKKHCDSSYSIQRVLYSYCLIKFLKQIYPSLSEEEIFTKHFGGIYYVFLRGTNKDTSNGIYAHSYKSYSELKQMMDEILSDKVGK